MTPHASRWEKTKHARISDYDDDYIVINNNVTNTDNKLVSLWMM